MTCINNILSVCDEVEQHILALNQSAHKGPAYFTERGADQILYKLPVGRQIGDMRRAPVSIKPSRETRKFVVIPGKGNGFGRFNGDQAEVINRFQVHIRYYVPPTTWADEIHVERMSSRDAEVISTSLGVKEWANDFTTTGAVFLGSGDDRLEPLVPEDGLFFMRLLFEVEYQYDGS